MSSPRPVAPSSGTPATSAEKRMHRVQWMQRFMIVLTSGPDVLVFDRALVLVIAAGIDAVGHRLVLKIAFAALVADRAVERMVDQQELHHAFARLAHHRRLGVDDRRFAVRAWAAVAHAPGAGRDRLGRALQLDQAHAAVAGDRQPFVEAEARDFRAGRFRRLEQRELRRDVDLGAVDDDLGHRHPTNISHVDQSTTAVATAIANHMIFANLQFLSSS